MIKIFGMFVIVLVVCSAGAFSLSFAGKYFDERYDKRIEGFDDCVASGYSVIRVYPRICVDSHGNTYTERIIN